MDVMPHHCICRGRKRTAVRMHFFCAVLYWGYVFWEVKPLQSFEKGVRKALPVCIGMLSVGLSFGLAARQVGLSVLEATMMSLIVVAGSSQFLAINMLAQGTPPMVIVLGTFLINIRHLVMSTYVMNRLKDTPLYKKLLLAYVVCDESFSLFSLSRRQENDAAYLGGLNVAMHLTWTAGTLLGALLMNIIPPRMSDALGIAIYATFIAILMPSLQKSLRIVAIVLFTATVNTMLSSTMASGTSVVLSMLIGAFFGTLLPEEQPPRKQKQGGRR